MPTLRPPIHSLVGHMPEKREIDVPLNYGDYYFLETLEAYGAMEQFFAKHLGGRAETSAAQ